MTAPVQFNIDSNTFDLDSLQEFADTGEKQKLLLSKDGEVSTSTWSLAGTKETRTNTANALFNTLKAEFGETIAEEIRRSDSIFQQALNGKPLTARQIKDVLTQAENKLSRLETLQKSLKDLKAIKDSNNKFIDEKDINIIEGQIMEIKQVLANREAKEVMFGLDFQKAVGTDTLSKAYMDVAEKTVRGMLKSFGMENMSADALKSLVNKLLNGLQIDVRDTVAPTRIKELLEENKANLFIHLAESQLETACPDFNKQAGFPVRTGCVKLFGENARMMDALNNCQCRKDFDALVQMVQTKLNSIAQQIPGLKTSYDQRMGALADQLAKECSIPREVIAHELGSNRKLSFSTVTDKFINTVFGGKAGFEDAPKALETKFTNLFNNFMSIINEIKNFPISEEAQNRQICNHLLGSNEINIENVAVMKEVADRTAELIEQGGWAEKLLHFESLDQTKATMQQCFEALKPALEESFKDFAADHPKDRRDTTFMQLCANMINAHLSAHLPKDLPSPALRGVLFDLAMSLNTSTDPSCAIAYKAFEHFFADPRQTEANYYTKENVTQDLAVLMSWTSGKPVDAFNDFDFTELREKAGAIIDANKDNPAEQTSQLSYLVNLYVDNQLELLQTAAGDPPRNPRVAQALQKTIARYSGITDNELFEKVIQDFSKPFVEKFKLLVQNGTLSNAGLDSMPILLSGQFDAFVKQNNLPKPTDAQRDFFLRSTLCLFFERGDVKACFEKMTPAQIQELEKPITEMMNDKDNPILPDQKPFYQMQLDFLGIAKDIGLVQALDPQKGEALKSGNADVQNNAKPETQQVQTQKTESVDLQKEPPKPSLAQVIEGNLKELLDMQPAPLSKKDAAEALQALFLRGEASAEDIHTVAANLGLDLSQYDNPTSPIAKTEVELRTMINGKTLTKAEAADSLQSMFANKALSADDVKTIAANLGLDMSLSEKKASSSNEGKGVPKNLTGMSQSKNEASPAVKVEENLRSMLNEKTLTQDEAAASLLNFFESKELSADDVKTVALNLGFDMTRIEPKLQGTTSKVVSSNPKPQATENQPVSVWSDGGNNKQYVEGKPVEPKTLDAMKDFFKLFLEVLNPELEALQKQGVPMDPIRKKAADNVIAKLSFNLKTGVPHEFLKNLMNLPNDTNAVQEELRNEYLSQIVTSEREFLMGEIEKQALGILDKFKLVISKNPLAENGVLFRTEQRYRDPKAFASFLKEKKIDNPMQNKDQVIQDFVKWCLDDAVAAADKIYGKNPVTGTMDPNTLPQVTRVVGSNVGVSADDLQVGHIYEQNSNTCFMMSVVNALCTKQEGVNHLKEWLKKNPPDLNKLGQDYNPFEQKMGELYKEWGKNHPALKEDWNFGKYGVALQVVDILGLEENGGCTMASYDALASQQDAWAQISEHLAQGEMCVVNLDSVHFVSVIGTYGSPSGDKSNFGLVIRDSSLDMSPDKKNLQYTMSVQQFTQTYGETTFSFFKLPAGNQGNQGNPPQAA